MRGLRVLLCLPDDLPVSWIDIGDASEALAAEPFDELACQRLMRAHAEAGNRAEALRVYAACRKLFREELGAEPSDKTSAVFLDILRH